MIDRRRRAERKGRWAEHFAAIVLMLKGYAILARRARTPFGEIDLIARRKNLVVFVEVKARATETLAVEAVTVTAQKRICRAAESWICRRHDLQSADWRFDIIAVTPRHWPLHVKDAWRPDLP